MHGQRFPLTKNKKKVKYLFRTIQLKFACFLSRVMRVYKLYITVFIHVILANQYEQKEAPEHNEGTGLSFENKAEVESMKNDVRTINDVQGLYKKSTHTAYNVVEKFDTGTASQISEQDNPKTRTTHAYSNKEENGDSKAVLFERKHKKALLASANVWEGADKLNGEDPGNETGGTELVRRFKNTRKKESYLSVSKFTPYMHDQPLSGKNACELRVSNESSELLTYMILKYKYNFVYLQLNFNNLTVGENDQVINARSWVWTFYGPHGGYRLLYLPHDFGYLSFGILWSESSPDAFDVDFEYKNGDCKNLTIGNIETDQAIGNALGNLTATVAKTNDHYNSSYWCYNKRIPLKSPFLLGACENSICTIQTFGFTCCRFRIDYVTKKREVVCSKRMYHYGMIWWALPIIIGDLLFAFYPLVLANIGSKLSKPSNSKTTHPLVSVTEQNETDEKQIKTNIYLSQSHPVSFASVLFSPLINRCKVNGPVSSRLLRTLIILLPMTLSVIRVRIEYQYSKQLTLGAVSKGGHVGFSAMIAGPEKSMKHFLYILGGPYVALLLYLVLGSIFILAPTSLQNILVRGLYMVSGKQMFVFLTPICLKEKLSRVSVQNQFGIKKIYRYFLANFFMILNIQFWRHSVNLLVSRWKSVFWSKADSIFERVLLCTMICPLYISFSTIELAFAVLFYTFPVFSGFFIFLSAYLNLPLGLNVFRGRSACTKVFCVCYLMVLFLALLITWYMYSLIFFDGFWFVSKVVMFTYSGMFAYPRLSYSYIILTCTTIYYLMDSLHQFGVMYRDLLELSIEIWEETAPGNEEERSGKPRCIPTDLFEVIIERCKPKRVQVFFTIFKVVSIVLVLCVSIFLLITFNRFEEVSLVSHVFTMLFICAIPKILNRMCFNKQRRNDRKKLRNSIMRIVRTYSMHSQVELDNLNLDETLSSSSRSVNNVGKRPSIEDEVHCPSIPISFRSEDG